MSATPALFDYASLPLEAAAAARRSADTIREHGRRAAESIIAIGEELLRVKEALPHGGWLPWLAAEFGWGEDAARRFMRVADWAKSRNLQDLGAVDVSALYLLSSPRTPAAVQAEALSLARSGERVTHAAVQGLIADRQVVEAKGSAVLRDAVDAGEVRLPDAREIARLPKTVQREVVEDIRAGAPAATVLDWGVRETPWTAAPKAAERSDPASAAPIDAGGEADDEPPLPLDLPAGVTELVAPATVVPDVGMLPPAALDTPEAASRTLAEAAPFWPTADLGGFLGVINQEMYERPAADWIEPLRDRDIERLLTKARRVLAWVTELVRALEARREG